MQKKRHTQTSFLLAALAGLLFGYDTGVISGALLFIKREFVVNPLFEGVIVAAVLLGCLIGVSVGMPLAQRFGRRAVLFLSAAVFIVGTIACTFALDIAWLIAARLVLGLAIGISSMCAPVYLAELAPAGVRGRLVTLFQLCITLGILSAYIVDLLLAPHWRGMFFVGIVPALILLIGILPSPESPRWLLSKGKEDKAWEVLLRVRSTKKEAKRELVDIKESLANQQGGLGALLRTHLRVALAIGVLLAFFQQATGINAVIYFAPSIFKAAGFGSDLGALLATVGVGVINVLATIAALYAIDRLGRRYLLLLGISGMIVTLSALAVGFWIGQGGFLVPLTVASVLMYIMFFAIGLGPGFWLLAAEIFPLEVRSLGMGIATLANWGSNLVVSLTFPMLLHSLGGAGVFSLYAFFSVIAWVFIKSYVPETKGKTLEEIEAYWLGFNRQANLSDKRVV
jgi:sugar porter (SP) family MFS transporter